MSERLVSDVVLKASRTVERGVESLVKKVWSVVDAASEKKSPSEYLSERARRSMQGRLADG